MLIRSAFWLGKPQPGFEQAFRSAIDDEMMPGFKELPGVLNARALWPRKFEDNPPPIHCQAFRRTFHHDVDWGSFRRAVHRVCGSSGAALRQ
jgi:hypothetical protein